MENKRINYMPLTTYHEVLATKPATPFTDSERDQVKISMRRSAEKNTKTNWKRSKKQANLLKHLIECAASKGYCFYRRATLIGYGFDKNVVSRVTRTFKDSDVVLVFNVENPEVNGVGTLLFIFKDHPNYENVKSVLEAANLLNEHTNEHTNENAEVVETPTAPTDEVSKNVPIETPLEENPLTKDLKDKSPSDLDSTYVPEYVDNEFKLAANKLTANQITDLWHTFKRAVRDKKMSKGFISYMRLATHAINRTVFALRNNKIQKSVVGYFRSVLDEQLTITKTGEELNDKPTYTGDFKFITMGTESKNEEVLKGFINGGNGVFNWLT